MDLFLLSPEISLTALALVVIVLDLMLPAGNKKALGPVALVGLAVPAYFVWALWGSTGQSFAGALVVDALALFFKGLFLAAAALVILASFEHVDKVRIPAGEYYALILAATAGLMLMVGTRELISIYVGLELATISLCLLAAFAQGDPKSSEAGLKYILLNAIASATLLYGMALLYGLTGSTFLEDIAKGLGAGNVTPVMVLALGLVVAGLGFKIAAVPFHMWVPDVYEGAPTTVTAFLSVASKAAGFALVLRVLIVALGPLDSIWPVAFAVIAAVTMTLGNVVAMWQDNVKRMLAYSSIAQAGYAAMAIAAATKDATAGLSFFLLAYTLTNLGAFIAVIAFFNHAGSDKLSDYAGLARRAPLLALGLTVCLLSLAGIPPMVGFISKVYLFVQVYNAGLVWLVILGLLNSAASMYYYLRPIREMYLGTSPADTLVKVTPAVGVALVAAVVGVFVVGIFPDPLINAAQDAALALFPK